MGDTGGSDDVGRIAEMIRRAPRGATVHAVMHDGAEVAIDAPKTRDRVSRMARVAAARRPERVEVRVDAAVVDVVVLDESAPAQDAQVSTATTEVERLLALVLRAQDDAVRRHMDATRHVVDAAVRVMSASAERTERIERALERALAEREEVAHAILAAAESEKPNESDELAKQFIGLLASRTTPAS